MRRAVRGGLLTGTLAGLFAAGAVAAPKDPAEREAQARFEEGLRRVRDGDFDAARASFAQAYAMMQRPNILWNLALCEDKTGHALDALTHFKRVARDPTATDSDRADAKRHADVLMTHTGHVDIKAPAGAAISVDGGPYLGSAPLTEALDVLPGHHVVEARLAQGAQTSAVDVASGQTRQVVFPSGDAATAAAPPSVAPVAEAAPSANAGSTTSPPKVALGAVSRPTSAEFSPGGAAQPDGPQAARIVTAGALAGAAAIAVGVGVYLGVESQSDASTAADDRNRYGRSGCFAPSDSVTRSNCSKWNDAVQAQNREARWPAPLYVAGGVLAAGAMVTWFFWPKGEGKAGSTSFAPWMAPGLGGVIAAAQF